MARTTVQADAATAYQIATAAFFGSTDRTDLICEHVDTCPTCQAWVGDDTTNRPCPEFYRREVAMQAAFRTWAEAGRRVK